MPILRDRISINPRVRGGEPVIKDTRIPISIILRMLRDGASFDYIIECYPRLSVEDIQATLDYVLHLVDPDKEEVIILT